MDTNKMMNIIVPPLMVTFMLFFMPFYIAYKLITFFTRRIYKEDVRGKVVLIAGASSGIGEYVAYEYAKRGARLSLVARREDRLQAVAKRAQALGSPDVIVIRADVSKVDDSERFIEETINHFGQLDHLVNNAGITRDDMIGVTNLSELAPTMDINFWGSIYGTHFAIPHLKKSKGKIIVTSSAAGCFPFPVSSLYNASKAAQISLFETLKVQLGSDIGITMVFPGFVQTEITEQGIDPTSVNVGFVKPESTEICANAIVEGACRGDAYITVPFWVKVCYLIHGLCPEFTGWFFGLAKILSRKVD
jgi:short-subunit dehydrogenase